MTTPEELLLEAPDPSHGWPISPRWMNYGVGLWRCALEVADPAQGSSVVWHDFPGDAVARILWQRGSSEPRGRYVPTTPVVEIWADDDRFAPWNEDTSDTFGVHVPLQVGLLMRFSVFRVAGESTDLWWPQWTGRVRRWRDQQTSARDGWRVHRVDVLDLLAELVPVPVPVLSNPGWKTRFDDVLTQAEWAYGVDVYAAETEDDGGGADPVLELAETDAQDSALAALDGVLDPVGLVMRTHKRGSLLVHPPPWDTFHAGKFDDGGLTIEGEEWVNPLLAYYPAGVVFSYDPADGEVGFFPTDGGESFGVDSDLEAVVNELQVTFPDGMGGEDVYAKDDPVSADRFGRRPLPARSWLAQNDEVVDSIVEAQAYTHFVAGAIRTQLGEPGTFPALMLLDHLDPVQAKHTTGTARQIVTAVGSLRSIAHDVQPQTDEGLLWESTVLMDVDSTEVAAALNPVEGLTVTELVDGQVTFGWTNPSQTITPTTTQVRIPQLSTQWLDMPYPITSFAWLGLPPTTTFRFEVRLIREVDGITTAVSDVRSVMFTTPVSPRPTPPPGGDGSVVVVPSPDPGCDLEWKLSESDDNGDTWTVVRSGDQDDLVYDAGADTYTLDNSDYTYLDGHIYEQCIREVCGGEPGEWDCQAAPFNPLCTTPAQMSTAPFDDESLVMYVPKICDNQIIEAVSGEVAVAGPAFAGIGTDDDGNYILTSGATGNVVVYGDAPNVPLEDTDRSVHWRGGFGTVEEVDQLNRVGRLRLAVIDVGAGVHKFAAIKSFSGGSITAIGTTTIVADTEYDVYATWDRDTATVAIVVDGTEEATEEDAANYVNTPNLPTFSARLPANSWCTELAAWATIVGAGAPAFNPQTDITWHSLFWVEGSDFIAQGYVDTDPVGTWPNETGESDAAHATNQPNYSASDTALNDQPAVVFTNANKDVLQTSAFASNPSYPVSIVVIARGIGTGKHYVDGRASSNRNVIFRDADWRLFAGSTVGSDTATAAPVFAVAKFDGSTGADTLTINGVLKVNANAGSQTLTGLTIGSNYLAAGASAISFLSGAVALVGIYEGDITADGAWDDFKAWVTSHYGIAIA